VLHVWMQTARRGPPHPSNIIEEALKRAGQTDTIDKAGVKSAKNMLELIQLQEEAADLERPRKDYNE